MAQGVHGSGLNNTSSVEKELGVGNIAWDEDGNQYLKCKAEASITANQIVKYSTLSVSNRGFDVIGVEPTEDIVDDVLFVGVNETGKTISSQEYFWCKVGSILNCLSGTTDDGVAVGTNAYPSATNGEVDDDSTGGSARIGVVISASSGAATACKVLRNFG